MGSYEGLVLSILLSVFVTRQEKKFQPLSCHAALLEVTFHRLLCLYLRLAFLFKPKQRFETYWHQWHTKLAAMK